MLVVGIVWQDICNKTQGNGDLIPALNAQRAHKPLPQLLQCQGSSMHLAAEKAPMRPLPPVLVLHPDKSQTHKPCLPALNCVVWCGMLPFLFSQQHTHSTQTHTTTTATTTTTHTHTHITPHTPHTRTHHPHTLACRPSQTCSPTWLQPLMCPSWSRWMTLTFQMWTQSSAACHTPPHRRSSAACPHTSRLLTCLQTSGWLMWTPTQSGEQGEARTASTRCSRPVQAYQREGWLILSSAVCWGGEDTVPAPEQHPRVIWVTRRC